MNVRVRSVGCRDSVTAAAAARRTSRSGWYSRDIATSSAIGSGSPSTVDADRAEHLLVEARPRGDAGDALLRDDLLLGLAQEVRAEDALRGQPVTPVVERRILQDLLGGLVLDRSPLEAEEEKLRLDRGRLLTQLRNERPARRVGHVRREGHVRVVEGTRRDGLDALDLGDRIGKLGCGERRDLAVVAVAERICGGFGLGEVAVDSRVVAGGVEIGEVPGNLFRAGLFDGCHGRRVSPGRSPGTVTGARQAKRSHT